MSTNLIFTDSHPPYAMLKNGMVVLLSGIVVDRKALPLSEVQEMSDDESLLRIRKSQWEANYKDNPKSTVRPPLVPPIPEEQR